MHKRDSPLRQPAGTGGQTDGLPPSRQFGQQSAWLTGAGLGIQRLIQQSLGVNGACRQGSKIKSKVYKKCRQPVDNMQAVIDWFAACPSLLAGPGHRLAQRHRARDTWAPWGAHHWRRRPGAACQSPRLQADSQAWANSVVGCRCGAAARKMRDSKRSEQ